MIENFHIVIFMKYHDMEVGMEAENNGKEEVHDVNIQNKIPFLLPLLHR